MTTCIWCIVVITIERYLSIAHPLLYRRRLAGLRLWTLFLTGTGIIAGAAAFSIPRWLEIKLYRNKKGLLGLRLSESVTLDHMIWYRLVGGLTIQTGGPFIVLVTLTTLMWMRLRQASKNRRNLVERSTSVEDDPSAAFVGAPR